MKDINKQIINNVNNDKGFIFNNNFKVVKLTNEEAIVECKLDEKSLNPMGIAHGGLIFGLADTASGLLAYTTGKSNVTTSANINYLKPGKGKKLIAIARKIKVGKNIGYYSVDISNENNELIAVSTVNMYFIN